MQSTTRRMTRVTSCALVVASAVALALAAGCSSGSETGPSPSQQHQPSPATPVTTTDSDWKPVADALGRSGKLGDKTPRIGWHCRATIFKSLHMASRSSRDFRSVATRRSRATPTTRPC